MSKQQPGRLMRAETAEIPGRFAAALHTATGDHPDRPLLGGISAIYTIARGSSDAAANIIAYEFMARLGLPVTSLPPSIFSLRDGVRVNGTLALMISQSGGSPDLVRAATGFRAGGGAVCALLNNPDSPLGAVADEVIDIGAGPELAVPATKSVVCTLAAGMALLGAADSAYAACFEASAAAVREAAADTVETPALVAALAGSKSIYVIGRGCGFGAAHEIALKLKECCALHAEAYSASEVLHGPLQLATRELTVLICDTGEAVTQDSLAEVERRFAACGARILRIRAPRAGTIPPIAAAAALLAQLYPVVLETALRLGLDPDAPNTLSKITETI